jgi:hypothetical protein
VGSVKNEGRKISAVALLDSKPILVTEAGLPKTIPLFKFGANPSIKGDFIVDETTLGAVRQQIANPAFKRVVIDFEHQSCKKSPNYKPAPRHHAAYGDVAITADNSIVLENVVYTPAGNEFAPDFHDVSPVPIHTADGVILGIESVGLVPQGALLESTLFSADFEAAAATEQETAMQEKIAALEAALVAVNQTLDALKAENAAQRQLIEDQAKLIPPAATPLSAELLTPFLAPTQETAAGAASAVAAHQTLLDAQQATIADQGQQITALAASIDAQRKETLIQLAAVQGKVVALADTAITAMSVEDLQAHISALGVVVPMLRKTPGSAQERTTTCLSAEQNKLIARIKAETGITNFQTLWAMAREEQPALFG